MHMMRLFVLAAICLPFTRATAADPMAQLLLKLSPDERAHQVCIMKGLDIIRHAKRLPQADRMKTGIFMPAIFDGKVVVAKGAAVYSSKHWYALTFKCTVTADLLKATSFDYQIGDEIAPEKWDELGLWP